jgi:hypothetical protein
MDKLPLYKIKVNEDLTSNEGIDFVSLVDYPAIESNWIAFNKQPQKTYFDTDKQMLYGAILIPDKPIYRFSQDMGEYNVTFPVESVIALVRKLQAQKKTINLNYQHQKDSQITDAVIQEIWLTGVKDKSQDFGFNHPVNTAMVGVYIGDKKFWNEEVKSGNVKGFSIEGFLDMELKSIKHKMNTQKFVSATTTEGVVVKTDAETIEVGVEVYTEDEAGTKTPAPDGVHTLDNGMTITVASGKVTEIEEAPMEEGLDAETVEVIQKAVAPIIAEMQKNFDAQLSALKVELSNQPAGEPAKKENAAPVQLNAVEKVKVLLTKNKK